jgi:hypothetical protein
LFGSSGCERIALVVSGFGGRFFRLKAEARYLHFEFVASAFRRKGSFSHLLLLCRAF